MNKTIKTIGLCIAACLSVFMSCNETLEDTYSEFTKDGETIYIGKPQSVTFAASGVNKVKLFIEMSADPKIEKGIILDNNGTVISEFDIDLASLTNNIVEVELELADGNYTLFVVVLDDVGNESVKQEVQLRVYGDKYESSLVVRPITSLLFDGVNGLVSWETLNDDLTRGSEVRFTNTNNEEVIVEVAVDDTSTELLDLDPTKPITYRTLYVPTPYDEVNQVETSLYVYSSVWVEINIPPVLKGVFDSITTTSVLEGVVLNWDNPTSESIDVLVEYTVGGETKTRTLNNSDETNGSIDVRGLEDGAQDIKVVVLDQSGAGFGGFINVTPIPSTSVSAFDTSVITIEALPTDAVGDAYGGSLMNLFDGGSSWYHTTGTEPDALKHHFTMDLGSEVEFKKFRVWPRQECCQDRNPSHFQLWGRVDLSGDPNTTLSSGDPGWEAEAESKGWVLILDEFPGDSWNGSASPWDAYIPDHTPVRYLRFRFISAFGSNPNETALAEFEFWE